MEAQKASYVGQPGVPLASAYYESDFDWKEHALTAAQTLQLQEAAGAAKLHQQPQPAAPLEGAKWEQFYSQHAQARFYKLRRYILLEFPLLAQQGPVHVMEVGCGCGSSILPVLEANPQARLTVTDVSTTCIAQLRAAAAATGHAAAQIATFVCDASDPAAAPLFEGVRADVLLVMFTLSAVAPPQQLEMLRNAFRALRAGGALLLRDHGLLDMVQLRMPASQWLAPNLYRRGDGTLAYFFSVEELRSRAEAAGFAVEAARYTCVVNRNRKTGQELRRVFVHGVFRKQEEEEE